MRTIYLSMAFVALIYGPVSDVRAQTMTDLWNGKVEDL